MRRICVPELRTPTADVVVEPR